MTVEARVLGVAVVGSGIVFLDGTIVNVALLSIRDDLGADLRGLQWILDAYVVTLTARWRPSAGVKVDGRRVPSKSSQLTKEDYA
ncbi:MAG: hypothetical protein ACRDKW_01910, partial [Actinomycetota bacterium]